MLSKNLWWLVRECYELLEDDEFFLKGDRDGMLEFFWCFEEKRLLFFIFVFVIEIWYW